MIRIVRPISRLFSYQLVSRRQFYISSPILADKRKVDQLLQPLSQKYADAKDEYEIATESLGTTYAKEDIASAKELTGEVVREYESILESGAVGEQEKKVIQERVGQRIRELVGAVESNLKEDEEQ